MSLSIYVLPVSARDRASFADLVGSGIRATDACDLIATINAFRSTRSRLRVTQVLFARYGLSAASAHSWLLARRLIGAEKRERRHGRWGRTL